ncbi:ice-binding family protein [Pontibacter arcticus]|uniref:Uncharacterized protein n=1 Tax=Pontibacter arcticus TaxID=2080288 RepID=A0A364RJN6_9BACT|nr:ice-binding family protein [Pontibacter arcticus]RAU84446.1 hypothetical protein DP923_05285 [Pontibacter arcticus]
MNKFLLSIFLLLTFASPFSRAQTNLDPELGQAGDFAVLAANKVSNVGISSGITGRLGIWPGQTLENTGELFVSVSTELGTPIAEQAQKDAAKAYASFAAKTPTGSLPPQLINYLVRPGVYTINGDATLSGILNLNGGGNPNAVFVFIIKGDLISTNPTPPAPSAGLLLEDGAQAKNVYWVVEGDVNLSKLTLFQGTILAKKNITLDKGVSIIGRAISLQGNVNLDTNPIYLPSSVISDLSVSKKVKAGDFNVGGQVTYTIKVRNAGPATSANVVVTERFPKQYLEYVKTLPANADFRNEGESGNFRIYRWYAGELKNGEEKTLEVVFKILAVGNGVVNNVSVGGENPDPNPDDNNGEEPIDVTCATITPVITGESDFCDPLLNINKTYTLPEVFGVNWNFTLPLGWTEVSRTANSITVNAPVGGKLVATVTDKCGKVYTAEKTVSLITNPGELTIDGAVDGICINTNDLTFTANGAQGNVTYKWKASGGITIIAGLDNQQTVKVNVGTSAGTLAVIATNRCGVSTAEKIITITPTGEPVLPTAILGKDKVCAGLEEVYEVTAVPGQTYNWTLPDGWSFIGDATGAKIRVKIGDKVVVGNLSVTTKNACLTSAEVILPVQISGKLAAPAGITATAGTCPGSEVTYSVVNPIPNGSYSWIIPTGGGWEAITDLNAGNSSIKVKIGTTNGTVQVALVGAICGAGQFATLDVTPTPVPNAPSAITGKKQVCIISGTTTYSVPAVSGLTYNWELPAGWNFVSGQGTNSITVRPGATGGTISVTAKNVCNAVSDATTLQVSITQQPTATGSVIDNSNVCDGLRYSVEAVPGASSYFWTVSEGFTITEGQGTTSIKVKANNPKATGTVTVATVTNDCASPVTTAAIDITKVDGELSFPKAFSPNNDGKNDTWVITNLEKFPENEITIMNRWGSEVYKVKNYNNTWNGQGLEAGTYFYKVKVKVCAGVEKEYTGYVSIFR